MNKKRLISLLILVSCVIVVFLYFKELLLRRTVFIKDWMSIIQSIVIIAATLFTAQWTYKTFAHKEKIAELKELMAIIEFYHTKLTIFCSQVSPGETPDNQELTEKLELAKIHNKLNSLATTNLYTRQEFRRKIQSIVGKWIFNDQIRNMQRGRKTSPTEDKIKATWQKFHADYDMVKTLIEEEAKRYIA